VTGATLGHPTTVGNLAHPCWHFRYEYSSALFARTAAKGNRELAKILDDLKIRPGRKKKPAAAPTETDS